MILFCTVLLSYLVVLLQHIVCDVFALEFLPVFFLFIICRFPVFKLNIYKAYILWFVIGCLVDSVSDLPFGLTSLMLMLSDSVQRAFKFNNLMSSKFSNIAWPFVFNFLYISVIFVSQVKFVTFIDYFICLSISQAIVLFAANYFFTLSNTVCRFIGTKFKFPKKTFL